MKIRSPWITLLRVALVLNLVVGAVALPSAAALAAAPGGSPATSNARVAIIVGPVGSLTDYYLGMARAAAAEARRYTDDVVTVYSPDATWPRVKDALAGASVVVYLGHGNGWPSRYSDVPRPQTQNGLGLNPVAGEGNGAHQYFGERYLERDVRLAPGAVVLLHHLCYASGAAEPGMAQPKLGVAVQRVDNFGAGWLAAGATAVIAEAHGAPAWYIHALFQRRWTIESMWRRNPNFHDHVLDFDSVRTPGARLLLDPDRASTGFYRSIVLRPGATAAAAIRRTAPGGAQGGVGAADAVAPAWASPVELALADPVVAGSTAALGLSFAADGAAPLPPGLTIGARWDPMLVDAVPAIASAAADEELPAAPSPDPTAPSVDPASPSPDPDASPLVVPRAAPSAGPPVIPPTIDPAATPAVTLTPAAPSATPAAPLGDPPAPAALSATTPSRGEPPEIDLVAPETAGTLVVTSPAAGAASVRTVVVITPDAPGLYRLVTTLHDKDGVAFDAASQDQVPALIVRVTGGLWASYGLPADVSATVGESLVLPARVANSGSMRWTNAPDEDPAVPVAGAGTGSARLVGHWVGLEGAGLAAGLPPDASIPADVEPGRSAVLGLPLTAPSVAGTYLLVLDITLPGGRSLAVTGVPPALVRVTVGTTTTSPDGSGARDAPAR